MNVTIGREVRGTMRYIHIRREGTHGGPAMKLLDIDSRSK